ncbi:hypothetical protein BLOT_016601 [Blomia tropicalis]|nr:hypothetical protein BLOT_016601 [Blomia tropicalis]
MDPQLETKLLKSLSWVLGIGLNGEHPVHDDDDKDRKEYDQTYANMCNLNGFVLSNLLMFAFSAFINNNFHKCPSTNIKVNFKVSNSKLVEHCPIVNDSIVSCMVNDIIDLWRCSIFAIGLCEPFCVHNASIANQQTCNNRSIDSDRTIDVTSMANIPIVLSLITIESNIHCY